MHDAWITLSIIAVGGVVDPIEEPTMLYRQHGENTLGARDASLLTWKYKIQHLKDVINSNIQHFKQMNAIKKISWTRYVASKVRYKRIVGTNNRNHD
jgi:rhamnosyltransferase